ncbi:hypothetical protein B296_00050371 [Ensete ventricosum]|uniref:Uncharacterized protein n=1 Tax=Ensete ventricosum TaxID=4639 RepID=A0A426YLK9_ENSVE|nr:hypothetical protein B296_00050371 [Ensete ventricosum]
MAADAIAVAKEAVKPSRCNEEEEEEEASLFSSYIGLSFALFLGLLPKSSASYVSSLQSRNRILAMKLFEAEDQLRQLRSRRKEDAKANARVTEIYAGHRNRWQQEEKRLLQRIDAADEEAASLRARMKEMERAEAELRAAVERLEKEVAERDEMLDFMARKVEGDGFSEKGVMGGDAGLEPLDHVELDREFLGVRVSGALEPVLEQRFLARNGEFEGMADLLEIDFRRESPWKVDGESSGVSAKLKLLEQELVNLEKLGKDDPSKILSLMRKQSKRYQSLAGKIDDLCRKMTSQKMTVLCIALFMQRLNDPCDPTLSPEFRTQRQTEFLLEAFRLQHTASETRQKLSTLQAEATKSHPGDDLTAKDKLNTRRSMDSIRNNFKEMQRNLEIWLARIMGDLEGILARDGASRVRDYYSSPFPFGR